MALWHCCLDVRIGCADFANSDSNSLEDKLAIAIGSVDGKLYAVMLDGRLSVCAERTENARSAEVLSRGIAAV